MRPQRCGKVLAVLNLGVIVLDANIAVAQQALRDDEIVRFITPGQNREKPPRGSQVRRKGNRGWQKRKKGRRASFRSMCDKKCTRPSLRTPSRRRRRATRTRQPVRSTARTPQAHVPESTAAAGPVRKTTAAPLALTGEHPTPHRRRRSISRGRHPERRKKTKTRARVDGCNGERSDRDPRGETLPKRQR